MPLFFAELGRHPALSLAELLTRAATDGLPLAVRGVRLPIVLLEGESAPELPTALGGILRFGEIIETHENPIREDAVISGVRRALERRAGGGKIIFGISAAALAPGAALPSPAKLRAWGLTVKKEVRTAGSARLLTSRERLLSPVAVAKNGVIAAGGDFLVLAGDKRWHLARTTFVHDFEGQARREFGRPVVNPASGMLPVQLARMLVNLSGRPRVGTLLDPFCGSGTVLGEAALLGWQRVIGSDVHAEEIDAARANLAWLAQNAGAARAPELLVSPVEEIGRRLPRASVDAVVTEPYLGPPHRGTVRREQVVRTAADLRRLYKLALAAFSFLLKKEGRVVMVFPRFLRERLTTTLTDTDLKIMGFERLRPANMLPATFKTGLTPEGNLLYARPDARVAREIVILEKKQ